MFERGGESCDSPGYPMFVPGKINRQSFIQMFHSDSRLAIYNKKDGCFKKNILYKNFV